jgi:hypothetical protein
MVLMAQMVCDLGNDGLSLFIHAKRDREIDRVATVSVLGHRIGELKRLR